MLLSSRYLRRATCIALAVAMLMTALFVVIPPGAEASGESWLDGWTYRKQLTISPLAGAGTNNQLPFKLVNMTGTDGSYTINGIDGGRIFVPGLTHEDFREIRFTASDGVALLDHWVQEVATDQGPALVWVEVPADISTSSQSIYIYWGNSAATSTSSGAATFPWFSDFNDATDLVIDIPGSVTFSNGMMTVGAGEVEFTGVYSDVAVSGPMALIMRYSAATTSRTSGICDSQGDAQSNAITIRATDADAWDIDNMYDGTETYHTVDQFPAAYTDLNFHELRWSSTGVTWNVNGESAGTWTESTATVPLYFKTRGGYGNSQTFDYAFFHKIVSSGSVTMSAFGATETYEAPPTSLDASFAFSPTAGYAPLTVSFVPTDTGLTTYAWSFGDGNTSSVASPSHTYDTAGSYTVTLNVSDGTLFAESTKSVTVSGYPMTSSPVTTGKETVAYYYQLISSVEVTGWAMSGADFLNISSTGLISGTPATGDAGTYPIVVTITATLGMVYQNYSLAISEPDAWVITSTAPTVGKEGVGYDYQVTCSVPVISWHMTGVGFMDIFAQGLVSGIPEVGDAGTYTVTITAVTAYGNATQTYQLVISAASGPEDPDSETPAITSTPVAKGYVNQTYRYQVACSIAVSSWSIAGADFLEISSSGLITGTPGSDDLGNHTISVAAQTAAGTVWQNYTLDIRSPASIGATSLDDTIPMIVGVLVLVVVLAALGGMFAKVTTTLGKWRHRQ